MKEREPESERMMNKFDSRDDNIKMISSLERIHTAKTIFFIYYSSTDYSVTQKPLQPAVICL